MLSNKFDFSRLKINYVGIGLPDDPNANEEDWEWVWEDDEDIIGETCDEVQSPRIQVCFLTIVLLASYLDIGIFQRSVNWQGKRLYHLGQPRSWKR
jgi:hypothetical protein